MIRCAQDARSADPAALPLDNSQDGTITDQHNNTAIL
jgi:hypothetical protein